MLATLAIAGTKRLQFENAGDFAYPSGLLPAFSSAPLSNDTRPAKAGEEAEVPSTPCSSHGQVDEPSFAGMLT